jgi:hypothetical protein
VLFDEAQPVEPMVTVSDKLFDRDTVTERLVVGAGNGFEDVCANESLVHRRDAAPIVRRGLGRCRCRHCAARRAR